LNAVSDCWTRWAARVAHDPGGRFRVLRQETKDIAWDFKTREAFARATFVEWIHRLPKNEWEPFIVDVLDRYQSVAADSPEEANTFKFYQMEVEISPVPSGTGRKEARK
jgi:hypothetical protein